MIGTTALTCAMLLLSIRLPAVKADGNVPERTIDRVVRDLSLSRQQHELILAFSGDFVVAQQTANDDFEAAMAAWREEYWNSIIPDDRSTLTMDERRRVASAMGARAAGLDPPDESFVAKRSAKLAQLRIELLDPATKAAQADFFDSIEAILTPEQRADWERSRRRLWIARHEGTPSAGGRPSWEIDMLGLLEEACAEEQELVDLADTLIAPLSEARNGESDAISLALIQFELQFQSRWQGWLEACERVYKLRAEGLEESDPRMDRAGDDVRSAAREIWRLRRQFAAEIIRFADERISTDAAMSFRARFYSRCVSSLFDDDAVDAFIAKQLEGDRELDPALAKAADAIIARYGPERLRRRCALADKYIDFRNAEADDRAAIHASMQLQHDELDALTARTVAQLNAIVRK